MQLRTTLTASGLLLGLSLLTPCAQAFEDSGDSDSSESQSTEEEIEYEFTEEELMFLEWLNSQKDAFWNNGLFDYFVVVDDDGITTTTATQDPEGKPTESGKTKGQPVPDPTNAGPCVKKYSTKVQTTMWIDNFDANSANRSFFARQDLFPLNQHAASRIAFNELVDSTNDLPDTGNPNEPANWEDRKFRASADLALDIGIDHGNITGLQATLDVRGGAEPSLVGTFHGEVKGDFTKFDVQDEKATIEYVMYGRPNTLSKLLFGTACAGERKSEWIWQHIRVEITTDGCGGYEKTTTILGDSNFPSDSIYYDGVLQPGGHGQTNFTTLWQSSCPNHSAGFAGACNYVDAAAICTGQGNYVPPLPEKPWSHNSDASSK